MRLSVAVIFFASCGTTSKPVEPVQPRLDTAAPPAPAATAPEPEMKGGLLWDEARLGPAPKRSASAPVAPTPRPQRPAPIYDRLLDTDGAVAGLTGFSTRRVRDPNRCGGQAVLTTRGKKIAPTDAKLVAVFALEFPVDLDFTDEGKKEASKLKLSRFVNAMTTTLDAARTQYEAEFASTDPGIKVAAAARLSQIYLRGASLLARAEIPVDVRTSAFASEATAAFCETLEDKAAPMLALGLDALESCRRFTLVAPAGWWAEQCKAP